MTNALLSVLIAVIISDKKEMASRSAAQQERKGLILQQRRFLLVGVHFLHNFEPRSTLALFASTR